MKRRSSRRQPAPLEPREYMRRRRQRRLDRNASAFDEAKAWAERNGFVLRVNNEGHHWTLQKSGFVAEWWPSSAKLILNRNYDLPRTAYDWGGVIPFLDTRSSFQTRIAPANASVRT